MVLSVWSRRTLAFTVASASVGMVHPPSSIASFPSPIPVVNLYGDIERDSCRVLTSELLRLDPIAKANNHPICLHIQSMGGELMPVFYVLDVIDSLDSPVWTFIDGFAASAATMLTVYGEKRFMTKRSEMLVHELRTTSQGSYTSIMTDVRHTQRLMQRMNDVYVERTNMDASGLARLMRDDVWLSAEESLLLGLVDQVRG